MPWVFAVGVVHINGLFRTYATPPLSCVLRSNSMRAKAHDHVAPSFAYFSIDVLHLVKLAWLCCNSVCWALCTSGDLLRLLQGGGRPSPDLLLPDAALNRTHKFRNYIRTWWRISKSTNTIGSSFFICPYGAMVFSWDIPCIGEDMVRRVWVLCGCDLFSVLRSKSICAIVIRF